MTWGLTGGIGAGKSEVAKILRQLGVPVLDADQISRMQMQSGHPVYDSVVATFGRQILNDDKTINRATLASLVFNHPALRAKLNQLTHGAVINEINGRIALLKQAKHPLIILEAALIFEIGLTTILHEALAGVLVVMAPKALRVQRVLARDQADPSGIKARMNAQISDEERLAKATIVIENAGTLEDLRKTTVGLLTTQLTQSTNE